MENLFSVEEMLGLKCPDLVADEVEIETSVCPAEILSKSTVDAKTKETKDKPFFEPGDYSNGARFDDLNYCWSQTINEIGVFVSCRQFSLK